MMKSQPIDPVLMREARCVSPLPILQSAYGHVDVTRGGRSLSVRKVLRADQKPDGTWISCDWYSGSIGDNISLVRYVTGMSFRDAVERLVGPIHEGLPDDFKSGYIPEPRARPDRPWRIPLPFGRAKANEWLTQTRGISQATVDEAFTKCVIQPATNGVIFLGYDDEAKIRYAAIRYYTPQTMPNGEPGTKKDLPGSSKSYPMVLSGDADDIVIVEGGINVLAVRDLMRREDRRPFIIASGGVGVRAYFEQNQSLREIIATASRVTLYAENEIKETKLDSDKVQADTDRMRARVSAAIAELRSGRGPDIVYPPEGVGDAADLNILLTNSVPCPTTNRAEKPPARIRFPS